MLFFLSVDFCIWRHDSPTYGLFHVFALYYFIGFVSLYFVVGRILAFRILSLMLCGNKMRLSFFGIIFAHGRDTSRDKLDKREDNKTQDPTRGHHVIKYEVRTNLTTSC